MKTTVVLFDLDDTLMPEMAAEQEAFDAACALAKDRFAADPAALLAAIEKRAGELWTLCEAHDFCDGIGMAWWEALWATFEGQGDRFAFLRGWAPTYRRDAWARALADVGVSDPAFAEEISRHYQAERAKRHAAFDDAEAALQDLGKDFRLGVLTNGAPDVQRTKLAGSGLAPHFQAVLVTGDIGIGKPRPEPFYAVLEELGATAEEAAMVGNSLTSDVLGARNAGIRSIWLNLDGSWAEPGITPDVEIHRLDEVRGALA